MGLFEKLMRRFGYIKLSSHGLTMTADGQVVPASGDLEGWRSSEGMALPLAPPPPAVEEELATLEATRRVPRVDDPAPLPQPLLGRTRAVDHEPSALMTPATRPDVDPPPLPRVPPAIRPPRPKRPSEPRPLPGVPDSSEHR